MATVGATRTRRAAGSGDAQPTGRAARKGTHRRAGEIIDAAARVFASRGYHGTTTTDIADALGIRQASLYYYLPSKEAALEAVIARGIEGHEAADRAIVGGAASPAEKLRAMIRAHLTPIVARSDYVRVFLNERHHLPRASRRRIGRISRAIERMFEAVVRDGIAAGDFRDVDARLATLAILGMCNAVPAWYLNEGADIEDICETYAGLIMGGLGQPSRRRRASNGNTPGVRSR